MVKYHSIDITALKVGDNVAVMSSRSFGEVRVVGRYSVIKADKLKIVIQRHGDDYTMQFSVKTGKQWDTFKNAYDYPDVFLATMERADEVIARRNEKAAINNAWKDLEKAVESKNIERIKETLAKVESLN